MFSMTLKEWRESIARIFKPKPKPARQKPTKRELKTFLLCRGDFIVDSADALTKSEARALFKKRQRSDGRLSEEFRVFGKAERIREIEREQNRYLKEKAS